MRDLKLFKNKQDCIIYRTNPRQTKGAVPVIRWAGKIEPSGGFVMMKLCRGPTYSVKSVGRASDPTLATSAATVATVTTMCAPTAAWKLKDRKKDTRLKCSAPKVTQSHFSHPKLTKMLCWKITCPCMNQTLDAKDAYIVSIQLTSVAFINASNFANTAWFFVWNAWAAQMDTSFKSSTATHTLT